MHKMLKSICLILVAAVSFSSCSHFSPSAKTRRAYAHQMKKMEKERKKKQKMLLAKSAPRIPETPPISEPQLSVSTE